MPFASTRRPRVAGLIPLFYSLLFVLTYNLARSLLPSLLSIILSYLSLEHAQYWTGVDVRRVFRALWAGSKSTVLHSLWSRLLSRVSILSILPTRRLKASRSCLNHLRPVICPLCRIAFQPGSFIKLHIDLDSVALDHRVVDPQNSDEVEREARRLHASMTSVVNSGSDEAPLRQLIDECTTFLHAHKDSPWVRIVILLYARVYRLIISHCSTNIFALLLAR